MLFSFIDETKEIIYDAMRHWEAETCIRFIPGYNPQGEGVLIFNGLG